MSSFRFFLLLATLGAVVCVTGATAWQSTPAAPTAPLPEITADAPDARSTQLFDQALAGLDPSRLLWLETELWQRANVQRVEYEAEGRYLMGPGNLLRLELTTKSGESSGALCVVCDGITLWEATRYSGTAWNQVTKLDMRRMFGAVHPPQVALQAREQFVQAQAFAGIRPLLQGLRQEMVWVKQETVRRNGKEYLRLTGVRPATFVQAFAAAGQPWPDGIHRQCRLYLEPQTLWPARIEWLGPDKPRDGDVPLLQMEFRNPVLNQPLASARLLKEFTFEPQMTPVVDITVQLAAALKGGDENRTGQDP